MPLQCNIDGKGKIARLVYGAALLVIGLLLACLWAWPHASPLGWIISAVLLAMGAFAIFEGLAGWCVMRAMGFKTPM